MQFDPNVFVAVGMRIFVAAVVVLVAYCQCQMLENLAAENLSDENNRSLYARLKSGFGLF